MAYDEQSFLNGLAAGLSVTGGQEIGLGDSGWWRLSGGSFGRPYVLEVYCRCDIPDYTPSNPAPWYSRVGDYKTTPLRIFDCVTGIGRYAFYQLGGLEDVIIPDSVTRIGAGAFAECSNLRDITIPDSVTEMENYVFMNSGVTHATIPGWSYAPLLMFCGCHRLKSVVIRDGAVGINFMAFYDCDELETITIPDSVAWIGQDAFENCKQLRDVYYGGTKEQWNKIDIHPSGGGYYGGNKPLKYATIHYNSTGPN